MPIHKATQSAIKNAAVLIRTGGIVAFPTETVYGLGADAFNAKAVATIFKAKGRPGDNPLIVHIADKNSVWHIATREARTEQLVEKLINAFWPGPLTLVLPKSKKIPYAVSAGLQTVAVRMPSSKIARALIRAAGVPIAAPSANISGTPSPTTAGHVLHDFGEELFILDGGKTRIGLESTVVDTTIDPPAILRHGGVPIEALRKIIPVVIDAAEHKSGGAVHPHTYSGAVGKRAAKNSAIGVGVKSPGMKYRHYAPKATVFLAKSEGAAMVREIIAKARQLRFRNVGILSSAPNLRFYKPLIRKGAVVRSLGSRKLLSTCARRLFYELRNFDTLKVKAIIVERFPNVGIGRALMERLERASQ